MVLSKRVLGCFAFASRRSWSVDRWREESSEITASSEARFLWGLNHSSWVSSPLGGFIWPCIAKLLRQQLAELTPSATLIYPNCTHVLKNKTTEGQNVCGQTTCALWSPLASSKCFRPRFDKSGDTEQTGRHQSDRHLQLTWIKNRADVHVTSRCQKPDVKFSVWHKLVTWRQSDIPLESPTLTWIHYPGETHLLKTDIHSVQTQHLASKKGK